MTADEFRKAHDTRSILTGEPLDPPGCKGDRMTASEFSKILDQFREALKEAELWAGRMHPGRELPSWFEQFRSVYNTLCCKWLTMKNAERPCLACEIGGVGGRPLDDDVAVFPPSTSPADENAEQPKPSRIPFYAQGYDAPISPSWPAGSIPKDGEATTARISDKTPTRSASCKGG